MPFYKRETEELLVAPLFVSGPGIELTADNRSQHEYPVEGWYWFDDLDAAMRALTVQPVLTALERNNAAYEAAIAELTAGYPPSEIATWERQRAEALAWQADNAAATPWIDVAAAVRGIPRADYLSRTYAKAAQFAQASAYLTGLRQRFETEINESTDPSAVVTDYTLPAPTPAVPVAA